MKNLRMVLSNSINLSSMTFKSWAEVVSGGSKERTLDNNVLITKVARKVNKEITESKKVI